MLSLSPAYSQRGRRAWNALVHEARHRYSIPFESVYPVAQEAAAAASSSCEAASTSSTSPYSFASSALR